MDSSVGLLHPHRGRMATPSHHRLGTPAPGARLATPAYRVSAMTASYSVANSILGGSSRGEWQLTSWSNQPSMGASALDALPRHRMGTPQYAPHAHSNLQSGAMYMPGFEGQHVPARRGDSANTALPSWHGGEVPGRIANASDILQTGGASVPQWGMDAGEMLSINEDNQEDYRPLPPNLRYPQVTPRNRSQSLLHHHSGAQGQGGSGGGSTGRLSTPMVGAGFAGASRVPGRTGSVAGGGRLSTPAYGQPQGCPGVGGGPMWAGGGQRQKTPAYPPGSFGGGANASIRESSSAHGRNSLSPMLEADSPQASPPVMSLNDVGQRSILSEDAGQANASANLNVPIWLRDAPNHIGSAERLGQEGQETCKPKPLWLRSDSSMRSDSKSSFRRMGQDSFGRVDQSERSRTEARLSMSARLHEDSASGREFGLSAFEFGTPAYLPSQRLNSQSQGQRGLIGVQQVVQ